MQHRKPRSRHVNEVFAVIALHILGFHRAENQSFIDEHT